MPAAMTATETWCGVVDMARYGWSRWVWMCSVRVAWNPYLSVGTEDPRRHWDRGREEHQVHAHCL